MKIKLSLLIALGSVSLVAMVNAKPFYPFTPPKQVQHPTEPRTFRISKMHRRRLGKSMHEWKKCIGPQMVKDINASDLARCDHLMKKFQECMKNYKQCCPSEANWAIAPCTPSEESQDS